MCSFSTLQHYEQADERFNATGNVRCAHRDWDFVENLKDSDGSFRLSEFVEAPEQQEKSQAHPEEKQCGLLFLRHPRVSLRLYLADSEPTPPIKSRIVCICYRQTARTTTCCNLRLFIARLPELRQQGFK